MSRVDGRRVGPSSRQRLEEIPAGSQTFRKVMGLILVGLLCMLTIEIKRASAATSCAEPDAPCVVEVTLTKSSLRVLMASNTKSIRASWIAPSGKIITKPLRVSKGTVALTVGGVQLTKPFALGLQACRTSKPDSCGQVSSWALHVEPQGTVTQTLLGIGAFWLQPDPETQSTPAVGISPTNISVATAATLVPITPSAATVLTPAPTNVPAVITIATTTAPATVATTSTTSSTTSSTTTTSRPPTTTLVKGSCKDGFVLRLATATDVVCVTPASASQVRSDNRAAASRRETTNDVDACKPGFVSRAANSIDRVCVRPDSAQRAAFDSDPKVNLSRTILPQGLDTCIRGFVFRNVYGLADDHVCVTPAEREQIKRETGTGTLGSQSVECLRALRGAVPEDRLCVSQDRRDQVLADNAAKESRKLYNNLGGRYELECAPPFVERKANVIDRVCVIPSTAEETAVENQQANHNKLLEFGPDTCVIGFVWREAIPGDHVCVIKAVKEATVKENSTAKQRVN
jgi:hypothetical protein